MRAAVGSRCSVKASGGLRTLADCRAVLDAGADRLGLSATAQVLAELPA
jgi:deoxyribose-phosphate aldolase